MDTDTRNVADTDDIETRVRYRRDPLYRPAQDRMVAGVASGIARYLNVDVTLVRIGFVVTLIFGGLGVALYLAGLLLIPEEGTDQSLAGSLIESLQNRNR